MVFLHSPANAKNLTITNGIIWVAKTKVEKPLWLFSLKCLSDLDFPFQSKPAAAIFLHVKRGTFGKSAHFYA